MSDSKLRLQIITQLDAAGIKATKDQVDKLEQSFKKTTDTGKSGFDSLEGQLKEMPGLFGALGKALGPVGRVLGGIGGAIALFKEGYEIGQKIREWAGETFNWAKTFDQVQAEIKETEDAIAQAKQQELDTAKLVADKKIELMQKEQTEQDKINQKITDQTRRQMQQIAALTSVQNARDNAEVQQLEREKFEEVMAYDSAGYTEASEQIGKAYDVMIQQLKVKQQLEQHDRDSLKFAQEKFKTEEAFLRVMKNYEKTANLVAREEEKLKTINGFDGGAKREQQQRVIDRAKSRLERIKNNALDLESQLIAQDNMIDQRELERSNIANNGALAIDRLAYDYDKYTQMYNNPGNFEIGEEWQKSLLDFSMKEYDIQKELLKVTSDIPQKLEQLLQIKQ